MSSTSTQKVAQEDEDSVLDVNELGKSFNLSTDGSPFDMDAILDAIPAHRKGIKYTDGWDPDRLDEVNDHPSTTICNGFGFTLCA